MESLFHLVVITVGEVGLAACLAWFVVRIRAQMKEQDAERRLSVLPRQSAELKKAA